MREQAESCWLRERLASYSKSIAFSNYVLHSVCTSKFGYIRETYSHSSRDNIKLIGHLHRLRHQESFPHGPSFLDAFSPFFGVIQNALQNVLIVRHGRIR